MEFKKTKNKNGKLKVIKKLKKFSTKRVFLIEMNKKDVRGNHGHKKHNQILLLFSGKIEITYFDIKKDNAEKKTILSEGEIFEMYENIHIKFIALKKSLIVVLANKHFNKKDYFTRLNVT